MRLTKLEIKGFKSFATDTVIHFSEDVIGIVGPNGSGKSNIVDAIRWVLGEQSSKELRLEKMSNVLFNGTKKRRPGNMAQVALTFENTQNMLATEYHSVTIARILFRSGQSEYRLNNVPCRLKDITSLFLDTGIGSNSYAIIALGMVDDILSDKENARRRMFEQAAGISKYKIRKRETQNKLKNTEADLERVQDLLFEIENNLTILEQQARRAKRLFKIKDQYKELGIELTVFKLAQIKTQHHDLTKKVETETHRFEELHTKTRVLEAKLESQRTANLDKEKALTQSQRILNEHVNLTRNLENNRNILNQKIKYNEDNRKKLKDQIVQLKETITTLEGETTRFAQRLLEEKKTEEALEKELQESQDQLQKVKAGHSDLKTELDGFLGTHQKKEQQIFELEKEKAISSNRIHNLRSDLARYEKEMGSRKEEIKTLKAKVELLQKDRQQKVAEIRQLELAEKQREELVDNLQKEIENHRHQIIALNRKTDALHNEFRLTKSMIENLEGFPESIKFLSKNKNWKKDAPLLSDLIYCQEKYRLAIENYLEPYLNYYVVPKLEDARQAIQLLSSAQKGKANFFILDAFGNAPVNSPHTSKGVPASTVVETDPPYRNLVNYLLENVVLLEEEDIPQELEHPDLILLTVSGRFIRRKYTLSGGSIGLFEGKKLGRKKNMAKLEQQIEKLEKEEKVLSQELSGLKSELSKNQGTPIKKDIEKQRKQLNLLDQEIVSLTTRQENFSHFLKEADARKKKITGEIKTLDNRLKTLDEKLSILREQAEAGKVQMASADISYRQAADELSKASALYNEKNIQFIRQQNKVVTFQQEINFRKKQLQENGEQEKRHLRTIEGLKTEKETTQNELTDLETNLTKAYEEKNAKEASLSEAEQVYFKMRGEINQAEDELRGIHHKSQDSQLLINSLKDKLNEVKLEIGSLGERVRLEFNVSINQLINRQPDTENYEQAELEIKVDRLRSRIDNYGEVNPMAVEAYDEMKERHDNITAQRDDILEAKKTLIDTIKEIEETATQQFLESFEKVRHFFIDVFRSLFTEDDNCDLHLLDPENPLDSNIEIVANPKGKRPQSISQLSGGEKTLTATALLFSLYLLKPAPFCIFDEVDAPLDDANIEKFNKIIKKFSKDSQFIIVTHNKQTMAAVDVIYGVYMQEQGVSNVSPVDFRTLEHSSVLETA